MLVITQDDGTDTPMTVVPAKATEAMIEAGYAEGKTFGFDDPSDFHPCWSASVAAAAPSLLGAVVEMRRALEELHAVVWGECPSLLNEDSGGDARLDSKIRAVLARIKETPDV